MDVPVCIFVHLWIMTGIPNLLLVSTTVLSDGLSVADALSH